MNRRGMTLIEVLLAITMLSVMLMTFGRYAGEFQRSTGTAGTMTVATEVARSRIELVRADPRYPNLLPLYGTGVSGDTIGFPGYPNMRRITTVVRDQSGTPPRDLTTVTVEVSDPALLSPVRATTAVARP